MLGHLDVEAAGGGDPIRIALVNDYEIVVHGIARMLDAYAGRIRVVELDASRPVARSVDVALYDTFAQPQADGEEVLELVRNASVGRTVVYTWNLDQRLVETALGNGAAGYLSKSLTGEELVAAIERIHAGEQVVSPLLDQHSPVVGGDWPGRAEGLSVREAEVIALITQGLSNQEIALRSHLSINSVKSYIRAAYRKMGVTRRSQAVLWGVRHGFEPDRARLVPYERETVDGAT